jgi:hypothetical protein
MRARIATASVISMSDVTIGILQLQVVNASGHEHRMQGIASRAARIFSERLSERFQMSDGVARNLHVEAVTAPALDLDLNRLSDHEAAEQIAIAWLCTQSLHFQG